MTNDEEILKELKKISRIVTLANGSIIEKELSKYATTDERKAIWSLMDGKTTEDIAKIIHKTKAAVDIFLKILERVELIDERKYGIPPVRKLDYIPSGWITLIPNQSDEAKSSNENISEEEQHGQ